MPGTGGPPVLGATHLVTVSSNCPMPKKESVDSDLHKGAVEEEVSNPSTTDRPNMQSQIGHRDEDELLKDADTDFPEPGSSPEHSGEQKRS